MWKCLTGIIYIAKIAIGKMLSTIFWLVAVAFYSIGIQALEANDPTFKDLKKIGELAGLHSLTVVYETPPSVQTTTWKVLLKKDSNDKTTIGADCPADSVVCGETTITKDGKDSVSELISFSEKDLSIEKTSDDTWTASAKSKWGEADSTLQLVIKCENSDADEIKWLDHDGNLFYKDIKLEWTNYAFCVNATTPSPPTGGDDKPSDDGMGWFSTIFVFLIACFGIYLVAQAWLNTSSMGTMSDFFNELVDVVVDHFSRIPTFIGEIVYKITGGGNNRGGYSAV